MTATRTFFVTGASSGIGAAITTALMEQGHEVVGGSRNPQQQQTTSGAFHPFAMDLARLDRLPGQLDELLKSHPGISGLVLAGGQGRFGSVEEFSPAQIRSLVDINLTAQILIARQLIPTLKRRDLADLIFIGSEASLSGGRRGAVYCATKFALRGFTEALRQECSRSGLRISLINPGMVDTPFFDDLPFSPGSEPTEHLRASDVAQATCLAVNAPPGTVYDQINLSPLKKVLRFKPRGES